MSEINDQSSDTSSELNWPVDHPMEQVAHHVQVVFENVADQYVKGEDVTAFFTILQDIKVNPNEDQIGLLRVGSRNIKECLAYAPVQLNPSTTSGSTCHGTATFSSSSLPVTDDEFYQFCYIINQTKNLGSSIPFQLNCALDDIDLLTNAPISKSKYDGLIALADQDNDDLVVIHTKRMLTEEKLRQENRYLLDMNRRLEAQRDECQTKLDLLEIRAKENIEKITHNMQTLSTSHQRAIDELLSRQKFELNLRAELDACQKLCTKYQGDSLENAERCRTLEETYTQMSNDANQLRSQLAVTSQFAKDQATQIINLERQLIQSNELAKTSNQRQTTLEQQIRDLRLTSEKHHLSMEGQLIQSNELAKTSNQREATLEQQIRDLRLTSEKHHLSMEGQLNEYSQQIKQQAEHIHALETENEAIKHEREDLQNEMEEIKSNQEVLNTLNTSFNEIKKRCVKHQKSEIEVKKQLAAYKLFIDELQHEKQELIERLATGAEEYKALFRKHSVLEQKLGMNNVSQEIINTSSITTSEPIPKKEEIVPILTNSDANQRENETTSSSASMSDVDGELGVCPMCYWKFPANMLLDAKRDHIDSHFSN
ncbi:hypothetical protein I4U23_020379 [Adineta vaga]|nr:hypothetical protein I4U23_020379 [Adineta vaga]